METVLLKTCIYNQERENLACKLILPADDGYTDAIIKYSVLDFIDINTLTAIWGNSDGSLIVS